MAWKETACIPSYFTLDTSDFTPPQERLTASLQTLAVRPLTMPLAQSEKCQGSGDGGAKKSRSHESGRLTDSERPLFTYRLKRIGVDFTRRVWAIAVSIHLRLIEFDPIEPDESLSLLRPSSAPAKDRSLPQDLGQIRAEPQ